MKKTVLALFGISIFCAIPAHAADNALMNSTTLYTPKFQMVEDTKFEDAQGSTLIHDFRESIQEAVKLCEDKKAKVQSVIDDVKKKIAETAEGSDARLGCEIYKNKLETKIVTLTNRAHSFLSAEKLLREILVACPSPSSPILYHNEFSTPNYEFFKDYDPKSMKPICHPYGPDSKNNNQIFKFKLDYPPTDISFEKVNTLFAIACNNLQKVSKTQRQIAPNAKQIYHSLQPTSNKYDLGMSQIWKEAAAKIGTDSPQLLAENIKTIIEKAKTLYIPLMKPGYCMAKVIIAFQEETAAILAQGQKIEHKKNES